MVKNWFKRKFGKKSNKDEEEVADQVHVKLPQVSQLYAQRGATELLESRLFSFEKSGVAGEKVIMTLPFADDPVLAKFYSCFGGERMHLGLLVEDFDVLAADIAYNYVNANRDSGPSLNVVTVFAEAFTFQTVDKNILVSVLTRNLTIECDISHVSDSGKSIEVSIKASTVVDERKITIGDMRLVMVPVNSETNKVEAGPLLEMSAVRDQDQYEQGNRRYILRKKLRQSNKQPVSQPERDAVETFVAGFENTISMIETEIKTYETMYVQNVNYYGKMFGGYLMRKMIELATTCVRVFVGAENGDHVPLAMGMTDVTFLTSVAVGDVSVIDARVLLCNPKSGFIVVSVKIENAFGKQLTDSFNLIFKNFVDTELRCVVPTTEEEIVKIVDTIRTLNVVFPAFVLT